MTQTKKSSLQPLPFELLIHVGSYCDDMLLFKALDHKISEKFLDSILLSIFSHLFNYDENPQNALKHPLFFESVKILKKNTIETLNDQAVSITAQTWKKILALPPIFSSAYEIQNMFFKAKTHSGKDLICAIGTIYAAKREKARRRILIRPNLFIHEDAIFKDDANIALSGLCRDETRLQHVSPRLQNTPSFVKKYLKQFPDSICYVNGNLRNDPQIIESLRNSDS